MTEHPVDVIERTLHPNALAEVLFEEGIAPFQSRWKMAERILARLTKSAPQRDWYDRDAEAFGRAHRAAQPAAPETGYVEGMTHGTGGNRLARPAAPETVCTCGPWKIGQPQGHLSGCPRAQPPETERLREAAKYALGAMRGQGWHTSAIPRLVKSEADLRAAIEAGDGS